MTIQTYYPLEGATFRMLLEREQGEYFVRFQREHGVIFREWGDHEFQVLSPRARVALIGSMARTATVGANQLVWDSHESATLEPQRLILSSRDRGYFIHEISRTHVHLSNVNLNDVESMYCTREQLATNPRVLVANWTREMSMVAFVGEMYQRRLSFATQFVSTLAIVVAVGTGIVMSVGFGPAAGLSGLGSSLSGTTTATTVAGHVATDRILHGIVNFMASGFTTFLQANFEEMTEIAQGDRSRDPRLNATRFWERNEDGFRDVVARSLMSGAFSYLTSYIPGPSIGATSDMTMRTLSGMILNRLGNNLAGVLQSIFTDIVQENPVNWQSVERGAIRDAIVRGLG